VERVGIEPANLSQHLAVLRAKGLVVNRREGTQVFYALRDPLLSDVLRSMRRYFLAHLEDALRILSEV
jgi:ArsR family transcriptional regulator